MDLEKEVVVLVGAGGIGKAIARRVDRPWSSLVGPGTDILADGGCTAAYWYGDLRYLQDGWSQS